MVELPFGSLAVLIIIALAIWGAVRVLREYERGVVFQLGRFWRVKVINAEGELQASEKLQMEATVLAQEPAALQLRYLQTLSAMSGDRSSLVVFPLPVSIVDALLSGSGTKHEVDSPEQA